MHNQDQPRTHTPGHENHGVHVCSKCGWHFPNPHPSAKHRRAHKKICGTIQGHKTHFKPSHDGSLSDDDNKSTHGLVVLGSNNEKGNNGIERKLSRSEQDDVFSDAAADFTDNGLSQGVKQILRQDDNLNSGTDVEKVNTKNEQTLLGSSEYDDFNAAVVSPLIANSSNDCQIKNSKIPQSESLEVGNIVGSQGQFSGSTVDALTSSIADLKAEELSIVHGDGFSGLSSDSSPSKAGTISDVLPEKNVYAGENVTEDSSLIFDDKESNSQGKDAVKSESDIVENVESTDDIVGETCEGVSDVVSLDHEVGDGAVNQKEKKESELLSLLPQYERPLEVNSSITTNEAQVESARAIQSTPCSDVKVLREKEDMNVNIDPLPVHDDRLDVAYPQSESLKHEEGATGENNFHFNTSQLSERSSVLSSDMNVVDSNMKTETEDCSEVSLVELATETYQRSHEIGVSVKTEMDKNHFSEELGPDDIRENSQPESSLMVSSNEIQRETSFQREASFQSATEETFVINNINDVSVDGMVVGANVENDTEVTLKDFQPCDFLQSEAEQSSDLFKNNSDDADETGKIKQCDITEDKINSNIKLYEEHNSSAGTAADSLEEQDAQLLVKATEDFSIKHRSHSSTNMETSAQHESAVEADSIGEPVQDQRSNNLVKLSSTGVDTSAGSHEALDAQLLVKATDDLASKYTSHSSINTVTSAQHDSDGEHGGEVSRITAVPLPVQDQSVNHLIKPTSPGTDASVDSGSRRDSLERNWGSSSVISMISDVPAVNDAETLPSTGSLASTEAGKSNLNIQQAAPADRQLSGKSETFELPSFTTLVEPNHAAAGSKRDASEIQNPQQSNSTSPAGWFPTLNQVINESEVRKKNEETITKITNRSRSKEHTPLKSLLGEATHSNKPKSPKMVENNGSGLTTVNSILGPESPSTKVVKEKAANEWNSPARYPANIKREKKKLKSRPFWIQLVCCSTVDPQRR